MPANDKNPIALIVDWGGVLTNGLDHMLTNWTGQENIDLEVYYKVFNQLKRMFLRLILVYMF